MAENPWVVAVLQDLGWVEFEEDGGGFVISNPSRPDAPIWIDPESPSGLDLWPQLQKAGVSARRFQNAIESNKPSTPYTSSADF